MSNDNKIWNYAIVAMLGLILIRVYGEDRIIYLISVIIIIVFINLILDKIIDKLSEDD